MSKKNELDSKTSKTVIHNIATVQNMERFNFCLTKANRLRAKLRAIGPYRTQVIKALMRIGRVYCPKRNNCKNSRLGWHKKLGRLIQFVLIKFSPLNG